MQRKILKYVLIGNAIRLPVGAQPLCVDVQDNQVCCWAAVDPKETRMQHRYIAVLTGHVIPKEASQHVKTFILKDEFGDNLVLHLYENWMQNLGKNEL